MPGLIMGTSVVGDSGMAAEMWERQEATPSEEGRTNLLDHLLQERPKARGKEEAVSVSNKGWHTPLYWGERCSEGSTWKFLLHRLIFLAKISPDLADKRDLAEYWEELFARLQRYRYHAEEITGLLLIYPTYVVHIVESSSDVLYCILRDTRDVELQQRALVLGAKILVMSHSLPSRLFQQWSYKVLAVPETPLDYNTPREESVDVLLSECLTALLYLGKHLLKHPKSPKNLPDAILEKVQELIVPQDTIHHLLASEELLSPAQYLDIFDSPLNILMDSGLVFRSEDPGFSHLAEREHVAFGRAFKITPRMGNYKESPPYMKNEALEEKDLLPPEDGPL
ncbi:hypothetical protein JRQ81_002294 [Phrynocephalus forsythii]|uniref:BLUF domain-containing protein n=1 Tax=Phrynocephalus forsythii TaxID=171643 RepID=A0A9Q0XI32_9SAUR|nr:hypothetical protein JRQ81_002294 [Phrynocephalus forsythii]